MPIELPQTIKIGYADFPLRGVETVSEDDRDGESSWGAQYLKVCTGLSHQHQANTLVHEIFHMCWALGNLGDIPTNDPDAMEEKIITVMANVFTGVIRDNPQMLAYFTQVFHTNPRGSYATATAENRVQAV